MAENTKADSAAAFMSGVRDSIRQELDQEYDERMFACARSWSSTASRASASLS